MLDGHRTWMRRLGTLAGLAMLMFGLYLAVLYSPHDCLPSTPEHQNACDVGTPSHPHFLLRLAIAAVGIAVLLGTRRYFADEY